MTEESVLIGAESTIDVDTSIGYAHADDAGPTVIGENARIRAGTIVYRDVEIGDEFVTGHNALIREDTTIGDEVAVGTDAVIDGTTTVGSHVSLQTGAYIPTDTAIGNHVFIGPRAVLTNDMFPLRVESKLAGPTVCDHVSIGANATVLPDVTIGERAFIAAGAVVTEDVPSGTLAVGAPARHRPLPDDLDRGNRL